MIKNIDIESIILKLDIAMDFRKLYLDPDLSLTKVAYLLELNTRIVSDIIKIHYGVSFRSYINGVRIDKLLSHLNGINYRLTVLQCMELSGFKSRVTFFHAFKSKTGINLSEFYEKMERLPKSAKLVFTALEE